ncbi:MAG: alpha-glucosidase [Eubacteriales bacterium]|nr:alpha-glucosidase [Eubacteriales bacterium]
MTGHKKSIVYQIWPRSFCDSNGDGIGDLNGIRSKLDHLQNLGVDLLWLSPVYASPDTDYGYDISDYYAIHPDFGTMADFDALLSEAEAHGIGLVMDLVANHTSDQHAWFQAALQDKSSKYRDYYIFRPGKDGKAPNNWMSFFGGSAWQKDEKSGEYYLTTFTPHQCDLNWENDDLRKDVYDMMRFWLDKGVKGFRMDVINTIKKPADFPDKDPEKKGLQFPGELICDLEGVHDFLKEMHREVLEPYACFTVGEGAMTGQASVIRYTKPENKELEMMFQFDLALLGCGELGKFDFRKFYRWSISDFKRTIDAWQRAMQEDGGWVGNYLSNHDQPRQVSRFGDDKRFRRESAKALGLLNLTLRGTPFIYQGEEIGMTNCRLGESEWKDYEAINTYSLLQSMMHLPKIIARRVIQNMTRDNARTPVQWNAEKNAGFTAGTPWLKVNPNYMEVNLAAESRPGGVADFYKKAVALRKAHDVLTYGTYAPVDFENKRVVAYTRADETETLLIAINLTGKAAAARLPEAEGTCLLGTHGAREYAASLRLAPFEGAVFKLR